MFPIPPNLGKWIQQQLDTYKERPRRGVPKGQPYGIPRHKYHVALLHLARTETIDLRAIARQAGVGYSLLLKWRTEDRFRGLIRTAIRQYSQILGPKFIYGDQVNEAEHEQFIRNELFHYSAPLLNGIMEELDRVWNLIIDVPKGERHKPLEDVLDKRDMLRMEKLNSFTQEFWDQAVNHWGTTRQKIEFAEHMAELGSDALNTSRKHFESALRKGSKKRAREAFDYVWDFAQGMSKEVLHLKQQLVETRSDRRIADDI